MDNLSAMSSIARVLEQHGDEIREEWTRDVPEALAWIFSRVILRNDGDAIQLEMGIQRRAKPSPAPASTSTSSRSGSPTAKSATETNPHPKGKITQPPQNSGAFHFQPKSNNHKFNNQEAEQWATYQQ